MLDALPPKLFIPERPAIIHPRDAKLAWSADRILRGMTFPFPIMPREQTVNTANSIALTSNSSTNEDSSLREIITPLAFGGRWIRATFEAASAATSQVDNASVGIRSSNADTAATPVEFLFSGVSGFTLTAGTSITSDWAQISCTTSDSLIVVMDIHSTNGTLRFSGSGMNSYFKAATNSYNQASVSGFTLEASRTYVVNKIEVRN